MAVDLERRNELYDEANVKNRDDSDSEWRGKLASLSSRWGTIERCNDGSEGIGRVKVVGCWLDLVEELGAMRNQSMMARTMAIEN